MKQLNNHSPLISIIMPVYNAGNFLVEAIESILKQTYKNWELIAVNDGSTDNSWNILKKLARKDKRIKIYDLKENFGLGYAANFAISKSKGKFIARFDADDLMPKNRLEIQLNFLQKNYSIVAVGGQCMLINSNGKLLGKKTFPLEDRKIRKMAFVTMSLQAGSMMINRKNLPKDFEFYSTVHHYYEDHELLFKLFQFGKVANLPQTLLYYRQHDSNSTKMVNFKKIFFALLRLRFEAIFKGLTPDINGILANFVQLFIILFLPNILIEKLYFLLRIKNNYYFNKLFTYFKKIANKFKNIRIKSLKIRTSFSIK